MALWRLTTLLRREQPDIVNASTPKAGLLGMLAAWLTRIPVRIYLVRGLRLETASGVKHTVLSLAERITAACAHFVICNSPSLRKTYEAHGFANPRKLQVIGQGSSNGIDTARFLPSSTLKRTAAAIRQQLGIPGEAAVIGFVGRFTRDKGIIELTEAFAQLQHRHPNLYLLMVGDFETGDPVPIDTIHKIISNPYIKLTGFVSDTAPYYHAMDILAFPSHREGFPNVPLEAAAAGIPTVGYHVTGVVDAVLNGHTGILVPIGSVRALAEALDLLIREQTQRERLGHQAQERVLSTFRSEMVWQQWLNLYNECLCSVSKCTKANT